MSSRRLVLPASLLLAVTVLPAALPAASSGSVASRLDEVAAAPSSVTAAPAAPAPRPAERRGGRWVPPVGVLLSDPTIPGRRRVILDRVITSVKNTAKGEFIRTAVWNYDDRAVTNALIAAHQRGVHVQIVVANSVANRNWTRTAAALNANRRDQSFAIRCRGGCRSRSILHAKFILFSRVHKARKTSMVGSFNLTQPAGFRQWNDLVTTRDDRFYDELLATFAEYAQDRNVARPFRVTDLGKKRITLWPSIGRNTIRDELAQVRCDPPGGHAGKTRVRIAIAGWFDSFGTDISKTVRRLWDQGCDVKIITTLAGRGVNQTLKNGRGRGAVPIRRVTIDRNGDRVPERYLHMKAISIHGGFGNDPSADVLITGSPNWSSRAQRSDEIVFRFLEVPALARTVRRARRPALRRSLLPPQDRGRGAATGRCRR